MFVPKQLVGPIDFHNIFFFSHYVQSKKSIGPINCLVTNILENILFFVQQKKEIHTGLEHTPELNPL